MIAKSKTQLTWDEVIIANSNAAQSSQRTIIMEDFTGLWYDCENAKTVTSNEQCSCEQECSAFLKPMSRYSSETLQKLQEGELVNYNKEIRLLRSLHAIYLTSGLQQLSGGYVSLDASRPWICYWIIHALYLLDREPKYLYPRVVSTLASMQNSYGGFGGGPQQITHCAPNYAAVLTLCTIGSPDALALVNRPAMYETLGFMIRAYQVRTSRFTIVVNFSFSS